MHVIRHLAEGQYFDVMLPGQDAVKREIHQVVAEGIEQHAIIGRALIAVM
jgi:hypothetical protein